MRWKINNMRRYLGVRGSGNFERRNFHRRVFRVFWEQCDQGFLAGCFEGYSASKVEVTVLCKWMKPFSSR